MDGGWGCVDAVNLVYVYMYDIAAGHAKRMHLGPFRFKSAIALDASK